MSRAIQCPAFLLLQRPVMLPVCIPGRDCYLNLDNIKSQAMQLRFLPFFYCPSLAQYMPENTSAGGLCNAS